MGNAGKLCQILIWLGVLERYVYPGILHGVSTPSHYPSITDDMMYDDDHVPKHDNSTQDIPIWEYEGNEATPDSGDSVREELVNVTSLNVLIPSCGNAECSDSDHAVCRCDRECIIFGDCCYSVIERMGEQGHDITSFHESVTRVRRESVIGNFTFTCTQDVHGHNSYFMIDKCPDVTNGSSGVFCSSNPWYDYKDIPMDYMIGGRYMATFRNAYCAECNGISMDELQPWDVQVLCKESYGTITILPNMTLDEIDDIADCVIVTISLFTPRRCNIKVLQYKTCPYEVSDAIATASATVCSMYVYPLQTSQNDEESDSMLTYRNIHCYVCNNVSIETDILTCIPDEEGNTNLAGSGFGKDYTLIDLQVIFDIGNNEAAGSKVRCDVTSVCDEEEVYDCISKTCRDIICPFRQSPSNGKCVKDSISGLGRDTTMPIDISPLTRDADVLILEVKFSPDGKSETEISRMNAIAEMFLRSLVLESANEIDIRNVSQTAAIVRYNQDQEHLQLANSVFKVVQKTTMDVHINFNIFAISLRNYDNKKYLECSTDTLLLSESDATIDERNNSVVFDVLTTGISVPVENSKWALAYKHIDDKILYLPVKVHTCVADDQIPNMNCSMVVFPLDDVIFEDSLVHILEIDVKLSDNDFVVHKNTVYVCSDTVTQYEAFVNIFENRLTYRIISVVTSSLSIAGVLVVIVAHIVKKRLRNAHGLNLTALSVSILILHVLLVVQVPTSYVFCHVYAMVLHATFLAMFTWTNIIGVDMARIFLADHIVSRSNPTKRFVVYTIVSISIPVLFVAICAFLDTTGVSYRPDYAKHGLCWLTNGKGVMAFVLAPVVVSLVLNICCFTITVVSIQRKTRQTKVVRNGANRTYVIVFLKMTIILGFTWVFGIVGSVWEQTWLSILNIILNGLQGLSILICSFVNARNVRQFRESIKSSYATNGNKLNSVTDVTDSGVASKDAT